jgi:hypothetical protein
MNAIKTQFKYALRVACHSFVGAAMLIAASVRAQNLFVSCSGNSSIYEYTQDDTKTGGVLVVRSTFASGLNQPEGLAFNTAQAICL